MCPHNTLNQARIVFCGGRPLPRGFHWEPDPFDDFDLWICCGGQGVYESDTGTIGFSRGDCFILPPGSQFRIAEGGTGSAGGNSGTLMHYFVHFVFVDAAGNRRPPFEAERFALHRRMGNFALLERTVQQAVQSHGEGRPDTLAEADAWLRTALFQIARQDQTSTLTGTELEHHERIEAICQTIRANPSRTYRVADLAHEHFYSPEHLTRIFKRIKGMPPGEFIIQSRIDAARELLLGSSLSISEIAAELGYSDVFFFSKQFRRRTGVCPSAYRRVK